MKFQVWTLGIIIILMLGGCYPKYQQEMPSMQQVLKINEGLMKPIHEVFFTMSSKQLAPLRTKGQVFYFLLIYKTGEVRVYPDDETGHLFKNGIIEGVKKNKPYLKDDVLLPIVFLTGKGGFINLPPVDHETLEKEVKKQLKKNRIKIVLPYYVMFLAHYH